ncbi:WXG100-like domain-containing protein [Nocardiopsis suaedae]|uniref:Outer membrane channel protein CpnT-like N-terminal domain-containing protein n=1 Tax=Nocardiopsis suaedae TaxID=3018444 RepID=A0ABT4TMI8_9ACTN|nr:hypothetical protein [Nocardiopsis suaedae]MDA2805915.1 hypothetical protein [Nocardiopsis suaedae]
MGMQPPDELRTMFMVLTGSEWPDADEDLLWELASVYGTTADRLDVDLPQFVLRVKNKVREEFDATAADFFDESVNQFVGGERNYLGEGAAAARGLRDYADNAATQVQYAKWMIIGQLIQLAAEIAWAIAMAPFTFGASLAKIPLFQAITRTIIGRVLFRLISELVQQMAISQMFALALDAVIQRIQIDQGNRETWDDELTEDAAKGALLDGLFGTGAAFGGSALAKKFDELLGNASGPAIAKYLNDLFDGPGGPGGRGGPGGPDGPEAGGKGAGDGVGGPGRGAADEKGPNDGPADGIGDGAADGPGGTGGTGGIGGPERGAGENGSPGKGMADDIGDLFGDEAAHLLAPYGKDAGPGWSRPVDLERFKDRMGNAFGDGMGDALGRGRAEGLGREYAEAFARNWGSPNLGKALDEALADAGPGLSPRVREILARGVPDAVEDGLAEVGSAWKTALSQYSSQAIANAGQGMLAEGFYNLLFGEDNTFSVTWLSAVSGAVSGAVQQGLTEAGIAMLDKIAGLGPDLPDPPSHVETSGGGDKSLDDPSDSDGASRVSSEDGEAGKGDPEEDGLDDGASDRDTTGGGASEDGPREGAAGEREGSGASGGEDRAVPGRRGTDGTHESDGPGPAIAPPGGAGQGGAEATGAVPPPREAATSSETPESSDRLGTPPTTGGDAWPREPQGTGDLRDEEEIRPDGGRPEGDASPPDTTEVPSEGGTDGPREEHGEEGAENGADREDRGDRSDGPQGGGPRTGEGDGRGGDGAVSDTGRTGEEAPDAGDEDADASRPGESGGPADAPPTPGPDDSADKARASDDDPVSGPSTSGPSAVDGRNDVQAPLDTDETPQSSPDTGGVPAASGPVGGPTDGGGQENEEGAGRSGPLLEQGGGASPFTGAGPRDDTSGTIDATDRSPQPVPAPAPAPMGIGGGSAAQGPQRSTPDNQGAATSARGPRPEADRRSGEDSEDSGVGRSAPVPPVPSRTQSGSGVSSGDPDRSDGGSEGRPPPPVPPAPSRTESASGEFEGPEPPPGPPVPTESLDDGTGGEWIEMTSFNGRSGEETGEGSEDATGAAPSGGGPSGTGPDREGERRDDEGRDRRDGNDRDREPPEAPEERRPVDGATARMLDALVGGGNGGGRYDGSRTTVDDPAPAVVDRVRRWLGDDWRFTAVGLDLLRNRLADHGLNGGGGRRPVTVEVPVVSADGAARATAVVDVSRAWRPVDDPPVRPTTTYESRAKTGGTAVQQSRKQFGITGPFTVIGEVASKLALLNLRLKAAVAQRQRGTQYQTAAESKVKRAVDAKDGGEGFAADLRIGLSLRDGREAGGAVLRQDTATVPGVDEVTLPGRRSPGPEPWMPEAIGDRGGPVLPRTPRFGRTLAVLDTGGVADRVAGDGRDRPPLEADERARLKELLGDGELKEAMGRLDQGEALALPFRRREGDRLTEPEWMESTELRGGPVHYERVGPVLDGTSFSDTDKTSASAATTANRTGKVDVEVEGGLMATADPAPGATVRAGAAGKVGHQRTNKQGRGTDHGAERARGASAEDHSALYRVTREYTVTTTEGGRETVTMVTLDLLSTEDATALTGPEWAAPGGTDGGTAERNGGRERGDTGPAPGGLGVGKARIDGFGEAHPVGLRWGNGDLRRGDDGTTPAQEVARAVQAMVHRERPDLVMPPDGDGHRPNAWNRMWRKRDTRMQNTLRLHRQVERAALNADALAGEGIAIDLRPSGGRNLFRLGPGPLRQALHGIGLMAERSSQDGADHFSLRVRADFTDGVHRGTRAEGKLSSALAAHASLSDGTDHGRKITGEAGAKAQYRHGETPAGLPWFIAEGGLTNTAEAGWNRSVLDTGKGAIHGGASYTGPVDSWSYTAGFQVEMAGGAAQPVPMDGGGPVLLVETPVGRPVPGEAAAETGAGDEGGGPGAERADQRARRMEEGLRGLMDLPGQEREARDARAEADRIADEVGGLEREAEDAREGLNGARRDLGDAQREVDDARTRADDADGRAQSAEEAVGRAERDVEAAAEGVQRAKRAPDAQEGGPGADGGDPVARAEEGLRGAEERLGRAEATAKDLREEAGQAAEDLREAVEGRDDAERARDRAERDVRDAEQRVRDREEERDRAQGRADRADERAGRTRGTVRDAGFEGVGEADARQRTARARAEADDAAFRGRRDQDIRRDGDKGDALTGLPHAPRSARSDDGGLLDTARRTLSRATGYARALWSGSAVDGQVSVLTSPRSLAAESDALRNGGVPLRQQYEDAITRRSDVDARLTAEDRGMSASEVFHGGGLDLTVKAENERTASSGRSFSDRLGLTLGLRGSPDHGAAHYNRLGGVLGAMWSWTRSGSQAHTETFTEEDQFSLPGSTVGVVRDVAYTFAARARVRPNLVASLPLPWTRDLAQEGRGRDDHGGGEDGREGENGPEGRGPRDGPDDGTVGGKEETRYRVVDLAAKGLLRGTEGLVGPLRAARALPEAVTSRAAGPGASRGLTLSGLDVDRAVQGVKNRVEDAGFALTDQSEHDIRIALSPNASRGRRRALFSEGVPVRVRLRHKDAGDQRFTDGGWMRIRLERGPGASAGAVEAQMSSSRTDTDSDEKSRAEAKGNRAGVTAKADGAVLPVGAKEGEDPALPPTRMHLLNAQGPLQAAEAGVDRTHGSADSTTDNRARTVKEPGVSMDTPVRLRFTLTHEGALGGAKAPITDGGRGVDAGRVKEIVPVSAMAPDGGADGGAAFGPGTVREYDRGGAHQERVEQVGDAWRSGGGRAADRQPQVPMPESVGPGVADALVLSAALAKGWTPDGGRMDPGAAEAYLGGKGGLGVRAGVLRAAAGEQVLRSVFARSQGAEPPAGGGAHGRDGAPLLGGGDGPFAVPGLDARLYTSLRPGEGRIIDVDEGASTDRYTQATHREERSGTHDGGQSLPVSGDLNFVGGLDGAGRGGFAPSAVYGSQSVSGNAAPPVGAGTSKDEATVLHTDHGAPEDEGRRFLVRMPMDALVAAHDPGGRGGPFGRTRTHPRGVTASTEVEVWLTRDQAERYGLLGDGAAERWDAVAEAKEAAEEKEKALFDAVDRHLGLDRDPRSDQGRAEGAHAREAMDLLGLDPALDPEGWDGPVRGAVAALRRHLGVGAAPDHGWDRGPDALTADGERAAEALNLLRERDAAGAPVLPREIVAALGDLVGRRDALHAALTGQRTALDGLGRALAAAWDRPLEQAPTLRAAFEAALNPEGGRRRVP